jgi:hypothetical protein
VEDSANGLRAALGAGLRTIVTVSGYTAEEDFSGAALVVSSLGERGDPARVLAAAAGVDPGGEVDVDDVLAILNAPAPAPAPASALEEEQL